MNRAWPPPKWESGIGSILEREGIFCVHRVNRRGMRGLPHRHCGVEITYCERGSGTAFFGNVGVPLRAGTLLVFDGLQPHHIVVNTEYMRWNSCVDFPAWYPSIRWGDGVDLAGCLPFAAMSLSAAEARAVTALFHQIRLEASRTREGSQHRLAALLRGLLQCICEIRGRSRGGISRPQGGVPDAPCAVLRYIEHHLAEDLSITALAERFHYSRTHLWRMIKDATGQSPVAYIRTRRLARAQALLRQTDLPVQEIGEIVGLPNAAYFCRLFKEQLGSSPQHFRRHARRAAM